MKNLKSKIKNIKMLKIFFILACFVYSFSYADTERLTVLYTGETHSMLYACGSCPLNISGGLAKRATKIKELRKANPNILLVDSGGVFAGGLLDEYTQSVELDKQRTLVNLDAMKLMGYDAVAVGDEEFNFGEDFLKEAAKTKGINFLSSNIENGYLMNHALIKKGNIKVGMVALSNYDVKRKISDIKYTEPQAALEETIGALKQDGADIIVVLSHLGEDEDLGLIRNVYGIDVLVTGHKLSSDPGHNDKIGQTIILRPGWQGRKLGKAELEIKDGRIISYNIDDITIGNEIKDDKEALSVLPECFSSADCRKKGFSGTCNDSGTLSAKCEFKEPEKISILIISPKKCASCKLEQAEKYFKDTFWNVDISRVYYETKKGRDLVKDLGVEMLPAYLFGREVEKNANFNSFRKFLVPKGDKYLLDPSVLGVSFFVGREKKEKTLDLFVSLYDKNTAALLDMMKDFLSDKEHKNINFKLHFIALQPSEENIITPYGLPEVEEDLRSVCVMAKYPDKYWDYLSCRAKNIQSSWWDDCLNSCGMNINLIKSCSASIEGKGLFMENIALGIELQISSFGTFLVDNQEVFSIIKAPEKSELEKMLK
ncbi:MAG: hypothetical protein COV72_06395 [Candidatus Omnitrophica bacterium CG11_big_fil_rev_8_21_14_0_20_42_13]|uniref:Bifunctional metallophosphatase/5'-nucleotidase n=1 Tax=Candidatus Ghiorseimicrobium undicola TaxID=1974746 RepID=A0A2H0LX12_9BACT|nr:MAG: hypothetical protein COV72_06395 [Candidatus Omnitrophica bacterium CG11_big_fil_rev_8_21_14_0_20_42_13]